MGPCVYAILACRGKRSIENDDANSRHFRAERLNRPVVLSELLKRRKKRSRVGHFRARRDALEIFERKTPFAGMADMIVINQILANVRPKIERTPAEFRALIQQAWIDDAKSRPNAAANGVRAVKLKLYLEL